MKTVNNVVRIPCKFSKDFFKYWLVFLKPFHGLTDRETDVAAAILNERYVLRKKISDASLLDSILMSDDIKKRIRESCNVSLSYFQFVMTKLRKSKFIIDGRVNPRFIPNYDSNSEFKLMLYFTIDESKENL